MLATECSSPKATNAEMGNQTATALPGALDAAFAMYTAALTSQLQRTPLLKACSQHITAHAHLLGADSCEPDNHCHGSFSFTGDCLVVLTSKVLNHQGSCRCLDLSICEACLGKGEAGLGNSHFQGGGCSGK